MPHANDTGQASDVESLDLEKLWAAVIEGLHRGPVNRSLWQAAERAKPITIENGVLIIGFNPRDMRYAGYLQTAPNRSRIQEIIMARTGRRLDMRVIEGDTIEDWRRVKQIERLSEERVEEQVREIEARRESVRAWADLNEDLIKLFSATTARRYPMNLARMFAKALAMVYETDVQVRAADPQGTPFHDRELNRICDKLASYCDLPATAVAVEYLRYRSSRRAAEGKKQ